MATLMEEFIRVRNETERRARPLSEEDQTLQSMEDASPAKWHRAHTTWFFEEFVLSAFAPDYRRVDERYKVLFNSYYVSVGERAPRAERGLMSRPSHGEVTAYRQAVDEQMAELIASSSLPEAAAARVILGLHHEQQHQELLLTDILHAFSHNPCGPAYDRRFEEPRPSSRMARLVGFEGGVVPIGAEGEGFFFDNEGPRHRQFLEPYQLASHLVTNGEWRAFMDDGGYARPELWLSDGWTAREKLGWEAPLYWRRAARGWERFTLAGWRGLDPTAPVCHVSYYEADAFARWAGKRLPSEAEWEHAAHLGGIEDLFGLRWQWTASAYSAYPRFRPASGAIGEYNGKFMANQMVLRGSACVTPKGHARPTYRNFFYPHQRWQFTGLRLADW